MRTSVATPTLNRPDRLNALGDTLREDLLDAILKCGADDGVGAIVIYLHNVIRISAVLPPSGQIAKLNDGSTVLIGGFGERET